jgi:Transglycosylase SLT domain
MPTGDPEDEARHKEAMGKPSTKNRWYDLVKKHADRVNIPVEDMMRYMKIESGGDAGNRTGSYKGLFQLSQKEFNRHGGTGNIYDPEQNTMAAANKMAQDRLTFKQKYNREPTRLDTYMVHQQGEAGYGAHMDNPDKPAWESVKKFYSSDAVAKKAIWGNIPDKDKAKYGSVENVTSAQFVNDIWGKRLEGTMGEGGGTEVASGTGGKRRVTEGDKTFDEETEVERKKPKVDFSGIEPVNVSISGPEAPGFGLPQRPQISGLSKPPEIRRHGQG